MLGLAVAMGIGRFFYTPLLPIMLVALGWSGSTGAWIATVNYLGYLVGCVVLAKGWVHPSTALFRSALVASTALLVAVAVTTSPWIQGGVRLMAGAVSAAIFVSITQFAATNVKQPRLVGVVYGGVGLGITVSGLVALLLAHTLSWSQLWLVAAIISAVFSAVSWNWPVGKRIDQPGGATQLAASAHGGEHARAFRLWDVGYFFQGFGYIIIGTYLVALAGPIFGGSAAASTWVMAGLAAVPSPFVWSFIAERFGRRNALLSCYVLQIIGALVAVFANSTVLLIVAAVLFGATFMGVTMLTISIGVANGIAGGSARLTSWYSVGQVAGPALVGLAFADSITSAFVIAAVALVLGLASVMMARMS